MASTAPQGLGSRQARRPPPAPSHPHLHMQQPQVCDTPEREQIVSPVASTHFGTWHFLCDLLAGYSLLFASDVTARIFVHTSCAPCAGGNPSQSFKEAALNDPFADLGNVRATQPAAPQTTPPLREVSPTQQRINLGALPAPWLLVIRCGLVCKRQRA